MSSKKNKPKAEAKEEVKIEASTEVSAVNEQAEKEVPQSVVAIYHIEAALNELNLEGHHNKPEIDLAVLDAKKALATAKAALLFIDKAFHEKRK